MSLCQVTRVPCQRWVTHAPFTLPADSLLIVAELLVLRLSVLYRDEHVVTCQFLQTSSLGMGPGVVPQAGWEVPSGGLDKCLVPG